MQVCGFNHSPSIPVSQIKPKSQKQRTSSFRGSEKNKKIKTLEEKNIRSRLTFIQKIKDPAVFLNELAKNRSMPKKVIALGFDTTLGTAVVNQTRL